MRIEKIIVKNFRSFNHDGIELTLPDSKIPYSIVGHNNSGKSNLINAILYGLNSKSTNYGVFNTDDFHNHDTNNEIQIEIHITPPLKNPNIYNKFNDIEVFSLRVKNEEGVIDVMHYCLDGDGNQIFNPASIKRGKKTEFSAEEKEILNERNKKGAQTAYKWKDKVPIYYIDPITIHNQLRANRNSLLGKVLIDIRKEFESKDTLISERKGVYKHHIGQPNSDVFSKMLDYIEKQIIPTKKLEALTNQIKDSIKEELEIESDDFNIGFGFPSVEDFYKNLEFFVKEHENKPRLPISRFGNGFIFLFVIALFKAIIESKKGGNIFIIEEPETFLHEHYQDYFYQILGKLAENNQVIYTTHSKRFVNLFKPQSIIKLTTPGFRSSIIIHHPDPKLYIPDTLEEYKVKSIEDFASYLKTLEPNLGNIIFARKVIIVEGPHDLLGYRTVLSEYNLDYNNISIVAAWGKDTIISIVQLCKMFKIEYYVIHDFDIVTDCDISIDPKSGDSVYDKLSSKEKAQYTKNYNIINEAGISRVHHNKPNLEGVLNIKPENKGSLSVYQNVSGKTSTDIVKEFPAFLDDEILNFIKK